MNRRRSVALLLASFLLGGARSAEATHLMVKWSSKGVIEVADPEVYGQTVFTRGEGIGPGLPPAKGGKFVIVDVVDRSASQIGFLAKDLGGGSGKRYVLRDAPGYGWMFKQMKAQGFLTTSWERIRGAVWDRKRRRTLAGKKLNFAALNSRLWWHCRRDCDNGACVLAGLGVPTNCDCEEWGGRTFCHIRDRYGYSDVFDRPPW